MMKAQNLQEAERRDLAQRATDQSGISAEHLLAVHAVAVDRNTILAIRPVDKMAQELIAEGHPTKGFHVKGKSANWGPQCAFIPVDQRLSKLNGDPGRVTAFSKKVADSLEKKEAYAVPLVISRDRLESLSQSNLITFDGSRDDTAVLEISSRAPGGDVLHFTAHPQEGDQRQSVEIRLDGKPVEVLAPTPQSKGLTADYDLFAVAPHEADFGEADNVPNRDISYESYLHRRGGEHKRLNTETPSQFYAHEDPEIGNASPRIREIIPVLNKAVGQEGQPVFHHNADSFSPAANDTDNFPLTYASPVGFGKFPVMGSIENKKELNDFITAAKNAGYHFAVNPNWKLETSDQQRVHSLKDCFAEQSLRRGVRVSG
ncbi:anthrax toxin-like adenylyl cyclase domain-containing protein [Martelella sp. HB161492]|uniref:anthrax toxin-like adenylyl cyclase domain-containing protein n=1 Tax=Martelella sp. HB161492 TaxID=2720726 RepID=UPI0015909021|nr:anthrax toxin-like adenylyl cyclase domain-containing protein [Martelella sp. HB161492]